MDGRAGGDLNEALAGEHPRRSFPRSDERPADIARESRKAGRSVHLEIVGVQHAARRQRRGDVVRGEDASVRRDLRDPLPHSLASAASMSRGTSASRFWTTAVPIANPAAVSSHAETSAGTLPPEAGKQHGHSGVAGQSGGENQPCHRRRIADVMPLLRAEHRHRPVPARNAPEPGKGEEGRARREQCECGPRAPARARASNRRCIVSPAVPLRSVNCVRYAAPARPPTPGQVGEERQEPADADRDGGQLPYAPLARWLAAAAAAVAATSRQREFLPAGEQPAIPVRKARFLRSRQPWIVQITNGTASAARGSRSTRAARERVSGTSAAAETQRFDTDSAHERVPRGMTHQKTRRGDYQVRGPGRAA